MKFLDNIYKWKTVYEVYILNQLDGNDTLRTQGFLYKGKVD